ncbi:hypothetical protein TetV_055 [Tetraselmis virus 1]|uniref:Uncharacterized protein n=1 Tax=Tetraselmis virus 1 TaxID=2060617 RepID=A0A2P0VMM1_9VIRU|nr:hypothetical protein QJ968_gp055 [Tetraselmis virus 1]AUF82147.1 hypothetical protein TetV_055 [Tetraselmis virus 1]
MSISNRNSFMIIIACMLVSLICFSCRAVHAEQFSLETTDEQCDYYKKWVEYHCDNVYNPESLSELISLSEVENGKYDLNGVLRCDDASLVRWNNTKCLDYKDTGVVPYASDDHDTISADRRITLVDIQNDAYLGEIHLHMGLELDAPNPDFTDEFIKVTVIDSAVRPVANDNSTSIVVVKTAKSDGEYAAFYNLNPDGKLTTDDSVIDRRMIR